MSKSLKIRKHNIKIHGLWFYEQTYTVTTDDQQHLVHIKLKYYTKMINSWKENFILWFGTLKKCADWNATLLKRLYKVIMKNDCSNEILELVSV